MIENKLPLYLKLNTTIDFLKRISAIDTFKGRWLEIETKQSRYLKELQKTAIVKSSAAALRMDGLKISDSFAESILVNNELNKSSKPEEQKLIGYGKAMKHIHNNYSNIDISENYLGELHSQLLKYISATRNNRGIFKKHVNKVIVEVPESDQTLVFTTTKPKFVQKEVSELIQWVNFQFDNQSLHPLVTIATFAYEFFSIHPFQDNNGLLSKLLTSLLLLKQGYSFAKYVSLDSVLERNTNKYYGILKTTKEKNSRDDEIIEDWIMFFLDCIQESINDLEVSYDHFSQKSAYLNERQKQVNYYISTNQPVKISDLEKNFPKYSRNTIKKDLIYLRNENMIEKVGQRRGTVYVSN